MTVKTEEILTEFPLEIRLIVNSIADENRLAILLMLLKKEEELTFSQIADLLEIKSNTLSHHLKNLTQVGLVQNFYKKKESPSTEYSFYKYTDLGKDLISNLIHVIIPSISCQELKEKTKIEPSITHSNMQDIETIKNSEVNLKEKFPHISEEYTGSQLKNYSRSFAKYGLFAISSGVK